MSKSSKAHANLRSKEYCLQGSEYQRCALTNVCVCWDRCFGLMATAYQLAGEQSLNTSIAEGIK